LPTARGNSPSRSAPKPFSRRCHPSADLHHCERAPPLSKLYHEKLIEAVAVPQKATFEAGVMFARAEGIIPAPESAHGIRACIDEALRCKASGEPKTLFFNLSGHGHFDMAAYENYFSGKMQDFAYSDADLQASLKTLPNFDWPPKAA
jgi:tryptophan synthase beta chain